MWEGEGYGLLRKRLRVENGRVVDREMPAHAIGLHGRATGCVELVRHWAVVSWKPLP
jgi:hypothetical protein